MSTAERYRAFAAIEAHGNSSVYEDWAASIGEDVPVLARIDGLPEGKRQPNLVLAAARFLGAPIGPYRDFRDWLLAHWAEVERVALARATQTNEAGRCAVLLPALAAIEGPIALLEVGASAGLCLFPDQYSYRYATDEGEVGLDPAGGPSSVVLDCRISGMSPPRSLPHVVWRAGIDLNPLDVRDEGDRAWLEALVWPGQERRREHLAAAAALVAAHPPRLVRGDAVDELPALAATAPADATLVVMHSAVLTYLESERRARFADAVRALGAVWLSNEAPGVLPDVAAGFPADMATRGRFVLARDGVPMALTGPHGQSFEAVPPR